MTNLPDTIIYPKRFESQLPAGYDGPFDWEFLRGAFGPVIMPMDFDGVIERKGNFLLFETKLLDKEIPDGQWYTFNSLIKTGDWTIFILWLDGENVIREMRVWHRNGRLKDVEPADKDLVWKRANLWYQWASKRRRR